MEDRRHDDEHENPKDSQGKPDSTPPIKPADGEEPTTPPVNPGDVPGPGR